MPHNDIYSVALETSDKQGLGRALDPRANGDSLSKLTELNLKSLPMRTENWSEEKEGMVERIVELRKGRRERIEKASRERIEIERKEKDTKGS